MFGLPSIAELISRVIVLLVAMSVHEFAHAYVAYLNGDDTAKKAGRMTLDPRANIYPVGFIIGVLIGFAILGSAPVNPYRMRNRRVGMFLAVAAGPISNLLVAAVFAIPFLMGLVHPAIAPSNAILPTPAVVLTDMVYLNVILFVFNLIPLFPLDGWTVMLAALPARAAVWWERHQMQSQYILFGLIGLSFIIPILAQDIPFLAVLNPLNWLIGVPTARILHVLFGY